jgi:hypothetical protein
MSVALRVALISSVALAGIYVAILTIRHRGLGWPVTYLFEAVALVLAPLPVPGATEMAWKSLQSDPLPVFNEAESRVALFFGGSLLVAAALYTVVFSFHRAWRSTSTPGGGVADTEPDA